MLDIYEQIKKFKKTHKLNNNDIGRVVQKSGDAFRMALKRKSFSDLEIAALNIYMNKIDKKPKSFEEITDSIFDDSLKNVGNEPEAEYETKSGNHITELPNGKYLLSVYLVPHKAHATYVSEFQDAEFIHDLQKVSFVVDRVPKGKYLAFEVQNDSMNDATIEHGPSREAILSGDIVLGRELGRHHWKNRLNTNGYPFWIIVHKDTILCKEIINHDIEKGIITCHSLNNSPEFCDFDLSLNDCLQLFNIIKKQV